MTDEVRQDGGGGGAGGDQGGAATTRDAILYVPGLGELSSPDGLERVARRIADALDRQSVASYVVGGVQEQKLPNAHTARVVTVSQKVGDRGVAVADVYEVDYASALSGRFEQLKPIWQGIDIFMLLVASTHRILRALSKRGKTFSHKLQVAYALVLFVGLAAYLPVVIATAVGAVYGAVPGLPKFHPALFGYTLDLHLALRWLESAVVLLTAAGFFTKFALKDVLATFAARYTPVLRYLAAGERQGVVQGAVVNLVNFIEDQQAAGGQAYARIHLVAYSFGTVVALDTLFPRQPPSPLLARVNTLVTIGCPFDFVRTYYPDYFERRSAPAAPCTWYNVYDEADVLSSNFINDGARDAADRVMVGLGPNAGWKPTNLPPCGAPLPTAIDRLLLAGFRRHGQYWERLDEGDINCFDMIVPHLYPAPAAPAPVPAH